MKRKPRIGLIFAQFSAYHIDRCEAVGRRLSDRYEVVAIEVGSKSDTYAWSTSGEVEGATKITLFPGENVERLSHFKRFRAALAELRKCDWVFSGIPNSEPNIIWLSWILPLFGVKPIMMTASKYEDFTRRVSFEYFKGMLFRPYRGAIGGGRRQVEYLNFLGFEGRRVLPGYDTVNLDRVLRQSGSPPAPEGHPFEERDFLFVGRFVEKKNLLTLLDAYARYCELAGDKRRNLVLVGSGAMREKLDQRIAELGIAPYVRFPGFLEAHEVAQVMSQSLALLLVSTEEQWGLVVNEAVACGLPLIVSETVGARDALVRELENGYVCRANHVEGFARAMLETGDNEARWRAMCHKSLELVWLGDSERFADAVETMIEGDTSPSLDAMRRYERALGMAES